MKAGKVKRILVDTKQNGVVMSIEDATRLSRVALKELSWLFLHIHKQKGSLALPRVYLDFLAKFDPVHWSSFYESQEKLDTIAFLVIFEAEDIKEMAREIRELSPEDANEFRAELEHEMMSLIEDEDDLDSVWNFYVPNAKEIKEYLESTSIDQQKKDSLQLYFMLTCFITQISQFLALVTHGKTMHDLVQLAVAGDDIAFCQAVQIDRTVLFGVPYFRQRLSRIQLGREKELLHSLSRAMNGKIWANRFPSPELWVVFSILQRADLLKSLTRTELLDICVELKVHKGDDPGKISSKRSEFLRRQAGSF